MNDLSQNTMIEFTQRYAKNPTLFVQEVLGLEPLDYQAEFLQAIADGEKKNFDPFGSWNRKICGCIMGYALVFFDALPKQSCGNRPHL